MAIPASERRALNIRRPFSRAEARAAGISLRELLGPRFHKVFYDCYVAASVPITTSLRAEAALAISPPGTIVSHQTAARLWGATVPVNADVHVSMPSVDGRLVRQGVKSHIAASECARTRFHGLPITTPEQTFLDLAAFGLDLIALVVLGDSLIRRARTTPEQIIEACHNWIGRGAKMARRAAGYLRDGVDSPPETRLRMLLVLAGLPEPTVNFIVRLADGSWERRFDLSFPEWKLIIEYDGRWHISESRQWVSDLKRREQLEAEGWRFIVITRDDLNDAPEEVLIRVRDALIDRGAPGIRRRFRNNWIRHFSRA